MNQKNSKNNDSGVALLFALGLLSLLLFLGLGFFSTVTISQKIAVNNNNRSQAKMLAHSAANQALMRLMIFQNDVMTNDYIPSDFTPVYSYGKFLINNNKSNPTTTTSNDFLHGTKSLLNYVNDLNINTNKKNQETTADSPDANQQPKWIYYYADTIEIDDITSKPKKSDKKIIGRAAYRVIPTTTENKIDISTFLSEPLPYAVDDNNKNSINPLWNEKNNSSRIPNELRLGREIDELNLNETVFHYGNPTQYPWIKRTEIGSTKVQEVIEEFFDSKPGLNDTQKKDFKEIAITWGKKWFVDSTKDGDKLLPITNETFLASDKNHDFRRRFNIGYVPYETTTDIKKIDNWYSRFTIKPEESDLVNLGKPEHQNQISTDISNNKYWNSCIVVNRIGADANRFSEKDNKDSLTDSSGIHFFKRIGEDEGSFPSKILRRKQIIANFNDYCDFDNIPTSGANNGENENGNTMLSATEWEVDTSDLTKIPVYTGNEQTPYINEVAIGIKLKDAKITGNKLSIKLNAKLFSELVNIYPKTRVDGTIPFDGKYTFIGNIKGLKTKFKLKLNGTVQYAIGGGEPQSHELKNCEISLLENKIIETAKNIRMNFNLTDSSNGYYVKSGDIVSGIEIIKSEENTDIDLDEKIKDNINKGDITIIKKEITAEIILEKYNLSLGNMMLLGGDNTTDYKATTNNPGVDYVAVRYKDSNTEITNREEISLLSNINITDENIDLKAPDNKFIICDFEVRDPRQNLNFIIGATDTPSVYRTDWVQSEDKDNTLGTIEWKDNVDEIPQSQGENNKHSNPKEQTGKDPEICEKVAWEGNEKDKHLSTAFIRNAPMWSPWELGAIHRAAAWETINLKSAKPIDDSSEEHITANEMRVDVTWSRAGTTYKRGDGAILEQIKMTNQAKSYGKIDIALLWKYAAGYMVDNPDNDSNKEKADDRNMLKALFNGLQLGNWYPTKDNDQPGSKKIKLQIDSIRDFFEYGCNNKSVREKQNVRTDVLNWEINGGYWYNAFGSVTAAPSDNFFKNDADQEEIVGKTINLLTCSPSLPNTIQLLVVAQTIKDIGTKDGVDITKFSKKYSHSKTVKCKIGQFDYAYIDKEGNSTTDDENITYFDEITGEIKMLVTIDRNPLTGRMAVRTIEYVE